MIVFDVGANDGNSCYHFSNDPNNTVYAFEPTPYLLNQFLLPKQKENYIVIPKAIGSKNETTTFYIAGDKDWGCSSIYQFHPDRHITWNRTDFQTTNTIQVDVITLEHFLNNNTHIKSIDFFHCDTQGNDLNVLKGLKHYISYIKEGVIELCLKNPLYLNANNNLNDGLDFLHQHNFSTSYYPNDPDGNEVNVHFKKISI
jgi:FkbM family methyltransferase